MTGVTNILRVHETLPPGFADLCDEALAGGFDHVSKLHDEWLDGRNRFARKGEALFAATRSGQVIGIGGVTQDPWTSGAYRLRRFFVSATVRRTGIGRRLATHILSGVRGPQVLTCHAPTPGAVAFWRAVGFADCRAAHHNLTLIIPA